MCTIQSRAGYNKNQKPLGNRALSPAHDAFHTHPPNKRSSACKRNIQPIRSHYQGGPSKCEDCNACALKKSYKTSYILIIDIEWGHED
ncbi:uncharacterized protein LACBIDRAFT_308842 [Laccaria bicolor S238N-H82]|uniref:Predicted protein n=1 Tax=Laccaria bicolor (strain S238N-H82 / ATCC MYA-4686) TaxID=486041 RepID=B0CXB8_LACBS|nr:uncharacterized protein LACBIDRAFT_308842 [Laccaria bicolor S238N-H82]EDR13230.1 predicted protein [Laccaria bicolor S238N-H82]|eukprot:XP_001875728.1 predicted protein [Laccaria bicolor S238N-H82]